MIPDIPGGRLASLTSLENISGMLLLYHEAQIRFGSHHMLSKPHFKNCFGCSVFSIRFERGNSPVTKKPNHPQGTMQAGAVLQRDLDREE